jgi:hypothetical protein
MRDTQVDVPLTKWLWAQLAFKDLMIRLIMQFTPFLQLWNFNDLTYQTKNERKMDN